MAAETAIVDYAQKKRKRKPTYIPKLIVDDRVEVRSLEEGSLGSWRTGVVIDCQSLVRVVRYDQLLCDDGSENLVESIDVEPVIDGIILDNEGKCNTRGLIRPLPPTSQGFGIWGKYGQCVDVYYLEAWWEGVIFDHRDGSEERLVFFPDMGDDMHCRIDTIRETMDWDEVTEEWKFRKNWLFLDVIEEFEQKCPLQVSVKQIWYELRGMETARKLGDWTNTRRHIWQELVSQVILYYNELASKHFLHMLDSPLNTVDEECPQVPRSPVAIRSQTRADLGKPVAIVAVKDDYVYSSPEVTSSDQDELSTLGSDISSDERSLPKSKTRAQKCKRRRKGKRNPNWKPAGEDIVPGAECCPSAVMEYEGLDIPHKNKNAVVNVRKHLLYLGWKIESWQDEDFLRLRYVSPKGKSYYSLPQLFRANPSLRCTQGDQMISTHVSNGLLSSSHANLAQESMELPVASPSVRSDHMIQADMSHGKSLSPDGQWKPAGIHIVPGAEYCPNAIQEFQHSNCSKRRRADLKLDVRKHLAYLGWKIEAQEGSSRLRYVTPNGKRHYQSLPQVLQSPSFRSQDDRKLDAVSPSFGTPADKLIPASLPDEPCSSIPTEEAQKSITMGSLYDADADAVVVPEYCPEALEEYYRLSIEMKDNQRWWWTDPRVKDVNIKAKKHLTAVGWSLWYVVKGGGRELRYSSPNGRCYNTLLAACKGCMDEGGVYGCNAVASVPMENINSAVSQERKSGLPENLQKDSGGEIKIRIVRKRKSMLPNGVQMKDENVDSAIVKKKNTSGSLMKKGYSSIIGHTRVMRSRKAAREASSSSNQNPRTVLSWLIDNDVVLPRAKVHYICRKDKLSIAEGRITRDGIKCTCCHNIFTLSKFEAHAGSTNHRPAANIFLDDGRSLLDCMSQLRCRKKIKNLTTEAPPEIKDKHQEKANDYICSVCHFGGELLLCDQCPSSFHTSCLGLTDVPDGDWFCASCCCGICGQSRFNRTAEDFTDDTVLSCDQCEHQYHVGCLRKRGDTNIDGHPQGNWFCNARCEQVFLGLQKLLGKSLPVGKDNLSWTLLKHVKSDGDNSAFDKEALTENYSKLNIALSVMHECFEPVKEPGTSRDLVEDVIFNRWSELKRLNFQGFYTVLLEKNDELVTAATIRVYGQKVAEVPLVGTRFQYRRLGMCRILMNELEKNLREIGVERLVLPAVPTVLDTWTTSFGFSQVTESERLDLLGYTFLDFQGTVMCQKILTNAPSMELSLVVRSEQDSVRASDNVDIDGTSAVSEVLQAERPDGSDSAEERLPHENLGFYQAERPDGSDSAEERPPQLGDKESSDKRQDQLKYYKRRRLSVSPES